MLAPHPSSGETMQIGCPAHLPGDPCRNDGVAEASSKSGLNYPSDDFAGIIVLSPATQSFANVLRLLQR